MVVRKNAPARLTIREQIAQSLEPSTLAKAFDRALVTRMPLAVDKAVTKAVAPLREEAAAAREAFELQATLRAAAEARAAHAERAAEELRARVAELEGQLAAMARPMGLFRRRRRLTEQPV